MMIVAGIAERLAAALGAATIADQHPAISAHRDNRFATANGVSWSAVFKLDLAG